MHWRYHSQRLQQLIARFGKPHQRIDAHGHEGKARRAVGRESAVLQKSRTLF